MMYKLFTFQLVLLFTSLTLNAQNSEAEYQKAVDFCACKIAYEYTKDFAKKNTGSDEQKAFDSVINKKLDDCNDIGISNLTILLKENKFKGFSKILLPDAENARKNYTADVTKEKAINNILVSFENSLKKIDIEAELNNDLNNKLQSFIDKDNPIVKENTISNTTVNFTSNLPVEELKHSEKQYKSNSLIPHWLLFTLLLLLSIILFITNYLKIIKLKESAARHREEIETLKNSKSIFSQNSNQNTNNTRFESKIMREIEALNSKIDLLEVTKNNSLEASLQNTSQANSISQTIQKQIQNTLYAKTPISDKVFNAFDVTEDRNGKFYQFTITGNNQAQFKFFNSENSALRAINAPDSFLYLACEEMITLNQNAKKIITTKPGIAIKQDDKWIVKEKAQITYE